ncbi:hypothetical protein B0A50_06527 [Salinomyces thailandicus]|uniref:Uncharacterized protein n=1 Tax=Salinomyces thailandicus TaxID=706561 RepID=A0A4U0TNT0_9PEZI|nr:hypothetical protein B0A50_06527 [Salinomyces thailandica]
MAVPFVPPNHPLARSKDDKSITAALREQIKCTKQIIHRLALVPRSQPLITNTFLLAANAGLLFPYGTQASASYGYDIPMITVTTDEHNVPTEKPLYQALLTYVSSAGSRHNNLAARGEPSPSAIEALESLLFVTASALERYQGNVLKEMGKPAMVAGGMVDEGIVFGKTWKEVFGGRKGVGL